METEDTNYKKYQKLVLGKNINQQTLLATDYLNHFNEIHMLLGMLADMPDCLEDILDWKSITYQEHFKISVFQDKELAIAAYNHTPDQYKIPFENCVSKMNHLVLETIVKAKKAIDEKNTDYLQLLIADYTPRMEKLIEICSTIINSKEITSQQDIIDNYFDDRLPENESYDQNSIDDLFE
ncbi:MAG: hypothetical protein KDF58_13470 [Alphaproteobacteria bacterium]|nr:hypothetical protein [Alphaproteobacteria bacterium]HPF47299.1 hypothetical protein [Emcibacteraceae bacterium]